MTPDATRPDSASEHAGNETSTYLTRRDVDRLTAYKWRYSLESHGFSSNQASHLLFMKWLYKQGSVVS
jgi:hypothetical protein